MASAVLSMETVADTLGWPEAGVLTAPAGAGPAMFAALARDKIGRALGRFSADGHIRLGILTADPHGPATEAPFGLVAEFATRANASTLKELQRLAWNFSHSPTLITIEPDIVRVWSCCEPPTPERDLEDYLVHQVQSDDLVGDNAHALESSAVRALHWLNLVSGEFFAAHATRFSRDGRADQMLLSNLQNIRDRLRTVGLNNDDVCHDLIARVIFVQFLFDRKDTDGAAALNPDKLAQLHRNGILRKLHASLATILSDYEDTYRLFDWLNEKFNGDLFPGKGNTAKERANGWQQERRIVEPRHLALLADFIRGDIDMPTGQACLWPQYSFDVIPLEFISSIYETFVTRAAPDGIFYTPPHLVDFVLDLVLPWNGPTWDLKILDPACGSGIFLVKAFQRLVHRWKAANPQLPMRAEVLRRLLMRNLLGVDKDPHAVRVACFSLYLAMCDEIEPRHYWTQVRFPSMRGQRLICSDFFEETGEFDSTSDSPGYDLVIGNAPWGDSLVTPAAVTWAKNQPKSWSIANKDIGSLFLAKGARMLKPQGQIALIQSANALLFNINKALRFRQQLFTRYAVDAIYNLSALRFRIFKHKTHTTKTSISPACIVVMRCTPPVPGHKIAYISPKSLPSLVDEFAIAIEPNDYRLVSAEDAANEPTIWPALMWGTARDLRLLQRLRTFSSLAHPPEDVTVRSREGIIFGDRKRKVTHLRHNHMFDEHAFPAGSLTHLDADDLPRVGDICTHSRDSTNFSAFALPQLIIKQGWQIATRRFQARLVRSASNEAALCTQSYITVHATQKPLLEAACLAYNSILGVYFMQLTSGRMAAYRPEARVQDLLNLPIPAPTPNLLDGINDYSDFDARVFDAFGLKDAERTLVEDMFNITLADFRADGPLPGSKPTMGSCSGKEDVLTRYCTYFIRVLKAGFGRDKGIRATIFGAPPDEPLPYRLVAFELVAEGGGINTRGFRASELLGELQKFGVRAYKQGTAVNQPTARRVARVYDGSGAFPTIFILKPDAVRYWTGTAALNDGDEVAIDLFRWRAAVREAASE